MNKNKKQIPEKKVNEGWRDPLFPRICALKISDSDYFLGQINCGFKKVA